MRLTLFLKIKFIRNFKIFSNASVLLKTHIILLKVRPYIEKIKRYKWNRIWKAKIQKLPLFLAEKSLHMLWGSVTPVGNRKVTSLYMKSACILAKENVFALRRTKLCQTKNLLASFMLPFNQPLQTYHYSPNPGIK